MPCPKAAEQFCPSGDYRVDASIIPHPGGVYLGTGRSSGGFIASRVTAGPALAAPVFNAGASSINGVQYRHLAIRGNTRSGSRGVYATNASDWLFDDVYFTNFADEAVVLQGYSALIMTDLYAENCLLNRKGRTDYVGVLDIGVADAMLDRVQVTASVPRATGNIGSGYIAGIVVRTSNVFLTNCVGHLSEVGIVLTSAAGTCRLIGCRADLNQGHGFVINGAANDVIGCYSMDNSQNADNSYDGFYVTNGSNNFVANTVRTGNGAVQVRHGFNDQTSVGADVAVANHYVFNRGRYLRGELYKIAGASPHGTMQMVGRDLEIARGGIHMGGKAGTAPLWSSGVGSPLGVLVAPVGSLYTRTDGGAATTLYVKESGPGTSAGWVAK